MPAAAVLGYRTRRAEIADDPARQLEIARQVLHTEAAALETVADRLDGRFLEAVAALESCSGSVIVTGMGKAGIVGQKVAATLASTGTRAHFMHPAEAVHGDLGKIRADDVVLAFSHSGQTAELVQILRPIKDMGSGLIGVTGRSSSVLARMADVAVIYGDVEEACPIKMAPSTSCSVMMAIGDALAFVLMQVRDFGNEDFGRFHPAGALGRKLQTVDETMRYGPQLRIAPASLTVSEVFVHVQRPGRRSGAILLVDDNGVLAGLFTDSDLARLFERRNPQAFDRPIREVMTKTPLSLRSGQRVLDALAILRQFQVSEIPVLDDEGKPIGLVDITDLVDLLPEAA